MSDSTIGIKQSDVPDRLVDNELLSVGAATVHRQRVQLAGASAAEVARVLAADPTGAEQALAVRIVETASARAEVATAASVVAGATANLDSPQVSAGKTAKLKGLVVTGSVPFKARLRTVEDGVESGDKAVRFADLGWDWVVPGREFVKVTESAGAGFDGFRVIVQNLDAARSADFYATFLYDEVG